jgi:hypothetical protein
VGRPQIKIDRKKVKQLASYGCTNKEISAFFDCSDNTIERRFAPELDKGRDEGKIRLRMLQWKHAERSFAMCIFLGKNILGQSDNKKELEANAKTVADLLAALAGPLVQDPGGGMAAPSGGSIPDEPGPLPDGSRGSEVL